MATNRTAVRRGLPRRPGGDPWPPADFTPDPSDARPAQTPGVTPSDSAFAPTGHSVLTEPAAASAPVAPRVRPSKTPGAAPGDPEIATSERAGVSAPRTRRGLPRVPGGEPWPPASFAAVAAGSAAPGAAPAPGVAAATPAQATQAPTTPAEPATTAAEEPAPATTSAIQPPRGAGVGLAKQASATPEPRDAASIVAVRRGLPRVPGGEPWPPADFIPAVAPAQALAPAGQPAAAAPVAVDTRPRAPLAVPQTVWPGESARARLDATAAGRPLVREQKPEPERIGPFTKAQWAGAVVVAGAGLLFAAAMAVLFVRWLLSLEFMQDFLATYPGEYHLPEGAPVGIPAWLGWQHFFNVFLMVLIIRSGLRVRTEKRPTVFWTPRGDKKGKISLNLWFHQGLDILWLVNGAVFVILLFVTGQWMRVIPTSWEVVPNALSAALQYVSLDWPTENGWVNYNSLQQLAYFVTIFVAAPIAAITGYRMSGLWPKEAKGLNRAYPVEWARAVHFPTMLYFVAFIAVHVFLVFATGALRNLNHMFAAQGSTDPNAYADNWTGFWMFVLSLVVIVAAWVAARPLVLAPIARLFGSVSGR